MKGYIMHIMSEMPSPSLLTEYDLWLVNLREFLPAEKVDVCIEMFDAFKAKLMGLKGYESLPVTLDLKKPWEVEAFLTAWENLQDFKGRDPESRNLFRRTWTIVQEAGPGRNLFVEVHSD